MTEANENQLLQGSQLRTALIWMKIIAVIYGTFAVAKRKPEKIQACTVRTALLRSVKGINTIGDQCYKIYTLSGTTLQKV